MEGLLTDCDVLKQLIVNRFPDVGEHDEDQWNLVSVKESYLTVTSQFKAFLSVKGPVDVVWATADEFEIAEKVARLPVH